MRAGLTTLTPVTLELVVNRGIVRDNYDIAEVSQRVDRG